MKDLPLKARRLIFSCWTDAWASLKPDQEFMAAINNCLYLKGSPYFQCLASMSCNNKGIIIATSTPGVDTRMLILHYHNEMVNTIREVDWAILDIHKLEKWVMLKVHSIPLNCFLGKGIYGVQKLQLEI
jgi:hypothetical protein